MEINVWKRSVWDKESQTAYEIKKTRLFPQKPADLVSPVQMKILVVRFYAKSTRIMNMHELFVKKFSL